MNGIQATRETLGLTHEYLEGAISDCEPETLTHTFPGATIGSILSIYVHALAAEDWAIQELAQKRPKLVDAGDWYARWGLQPPEPEKEMDWSAINVPFSEVQAYAKAVYAATDEWLAGVNDGDLDQKIDWHSGPKSLGWVLADVINVHLSFHAGEISSLKGVMGLKGLPW